MVVYEERTVAELKEICKKRGLTCSGLKKKELIDKLRGKGSKGSKGKKKPTSPKKKKSPAKKKVSSPKPPPLPPKPKKLKSYDSLNKMLVNSCKYGDIDNVRSLFSRYNFDSDTLVDCAGIARYYEHDDIIQLLINRFSAEQLGL